MLLTGQRILLPAYGVAMYLCILPVQALDFVGSVNNTSAYTSNTLKTEANEVGEWTHHPGLDLAATRDSTSWLINADYHYFRRLYQKDFWKDESITTGQGSARWRAVPHRLDFFINNSRTESSIQALQTQTQDNRQIVSNTKAGATVILQPTGKENALQLEYVYVETTASDTQSDSERHNGTLSYTLGSSTNSSMQLQTTHSKISYSGFFPDATFTIATLNYAKVVRDLELDVKLGHNWFDRSDRGKTDDSSYDVAVLWHVSSLSTVNFSAFYGIVDQSRNLPGNGGTVNENTGINAAFNESRGSLSLTQKWGRTTLTFGGDWTKQEYAPDVPLDNDRIGFKFALFRNLTRTVDATVDIEVVSRDFIDQGDDQDEIEVNFRFKHKLGQTLSLSWGGDYIKRESNTNTSFEEWQASLELRYTFIGARKRTPKGAGSIRGNPQALSLGQ
jgi:hypothetical protein